jgi:hypothetical protein
MSERLTLTREEIRELTGVWQHAAQARALARLKIPFERRTTDGSCIVGREQVKRGMAFGTRRDPAIPAANEAGIKWSTAA